MDFKNTIKQLVKGDYSIDLIKKSLLFVLFVCPSLLCAQQTIVSKAVMASLELNVKQSKAQWEKYQVYAGLGKVEERFSAKSPSDMVIAFNKFADSLKVKTSPYLVYKNSIAEAYSEIKDSSTNSPLFLYSEGNFPVSFLKYKSPLNAVIFNGLVSLKTGTTLNTPERQRASQIISSMLLPIVKAIAGQFNQTINYYGVSACYGSKDFYDDSSTPIKAEYVLLIVPANLATKYKEGQIKADELFNKSDIYFSGRDEDSELNRMTNISE